MYSSGSLDSRRNSRDYGGRGGRGGRGGGGFRQRDFGPPRGQGPYSRDGPPPPRQFSQGRPHNGPPPQAPLQIDREKVCPLLLRVFPKEGEHHKVEDFATRGKEPEDEVQMYTWMDATLRELTDLVKEVQTAARNPRARLQFALVYPDRQGQNVLKPVGSVHASRHGPDDLKTLKTVGFQTGDFLDVAILV